MVTKCSCQELSKCWTKIDFPQFEYFFFFFLVLLTDHNKSGSLSTKYQIWNYPPTIDQPTSKYLDRDMILFFYKLSRNGNDEMLKYRNLVGHLPSALVCMTRWLGRPPGPRTTLGPASASGLGVRPATAWVAAAGRGSAGGPGGGGRGRRRRRGSGCRRAWNGGCGLNEFWLSRTQELEKK